MNKISSDVFKLIERGDMGLINLEKNTAGIAYFYKMLNSVYGFVLGTALIITTLIWMFEYLIDYSKQEIANRLIRYCVQSLPIVILLNIGCALFIFAFLFFKGLFKALKPVPVVKPVISEPIQAESNVSVKKPEPVILKEDTDTFVLAESETPVELKEDTPAVLKVELREAVAAKTESVVQIDNGGGVEV